MEEGLVDQSLRRDAATPTFAIRYSMGTGGAASSAIAAHDGHVNSSGNCSSSAVAVNHRAPLFFVSAVRRRCQCQTDPTPVGRRF